MKAIVRKRQKRKLVEIDKGELAFKVRGRSVEPEKIDRWMKRNGVTDTMIYAPSPSACKRASISPFLQSVSTSRANIDSYPCGAQRLDGFRARLSSSKSW